MSQAGGHCPSERSRFKAEPWDTCGGCLCPLQLPTPLHRRPLLHCPWSMACRRDMDGVVKGRGGPWARVSRESRAAGGVLAPGSVDTRACSRCLRNVKTQGDGTTRH